MARGELNLKYSVSYPEDFKAEADPQSLYERTLCGGGTVLNNLSREIHKSAVEHGWWKGGRSVPEILMLCVSELSEALEEYRNGEPEGTMYYNCPGGAKYYPETPEWDSVSKPEGIPVEVADCVIRCLDALCAWNVDIDAVLFAKMGYNAKRPYRHGGKKV